MCNATGANTPVPHTPNTHPLSATEAHAAPASDEPTECLAREAWRLDDDMVVASEDTCRVGENAPRAPCMACVFDHSSGKFTAQLLRSTGVGKNRPLKIGSHAFVRCYNEDFLRVNVLAMEWNEGCGHPMLANETPVLFAGEIEVDADQNLVRWSNLSGTYRCPSWTADQASLPLERFHAWRTAKNNCTQQIRKNKCKQQVAAGIPTIIPLVSEHRMPDTASSRAHT